MHIFVHFDKCLLGLASCSCRNKCTEKFSDYEKGNIIAKLYAGQRKNEQDTFLLGLIEVKPCARKRKRTTANDSSKSNTFTYFVSTGSKKEIVLSQCQVQCLNTLLVAGKSRDMREKHNTRPHVLQKDTLLKIHEHISSFPTKTTHYGSKPICYLDARLTVQAMYGLFIKKYPDLQGKVKYEFYLKYFNQNFSLRFGRSQVDVCSTCEALGVKLSDPHLNDNAKRVADAELLVHKRRAKKCRICRSFSLKILKLLQSLSTTCKICHFQ